MRTGIGRTKLFLAASVAALGLAVPTSAMAEDVEVAGLGGTELSLGVSLPAAMTLGYSTPGAATSVATVTSTSLGWTLSIVDNDVAGSGAPGHMHPCLDPEGDNLADPLQWSSDGGTTYNNLSGTPATVGTGSLVGAFTVHYRQALDPSVDEVATGDCYKLTATYTVTG